MTNDLGRVPLAPGSREPSPAVSAASGFDPSRIRVMEWAADHGQVRLTYPDYLTIEDLNELEQLFALTIKIGRRRASAIETRSAETGTGSVEDESAAPKADAQPLSPETPHAD